MPARTKVSKMTINIKMGPEDSSGTWELDVECFFVLSKCLLELVRRGRDMYNKAVKNHGNHQTNTIICCFLYLLLTVVVVVKIMIIKTIIIILFASLSSFIPVLADGLFLESEWQQVSSGLQDSSQYSGQSQ